jgi:hypothetical protein
MAWKHLGSPTKKKFFHGKGDATSFFFGGGDSEGPILEDYLEKGCTALSSSLVTLLAEQLCLHCRSSKETDVIKVKL